MDIEDLKVFIDLVNSQSFSRCAEMNFLTQPAISQKIKRLEEDTDAELLKRGKKGAALTPAGEIFFEQSKKIFREYQEIIPKIKELSGKVHGTIRVGAIYSIGLYELDSLTKTFLKNYPDVTLDIELSHASKIYSSLMEEKIDVGFVSYPEAKPCFKIIPFKTDKLILVAHPKHPISKHSRIPFKNISGLDFVGFRENSPTGKALENTFKKHKIEINEKMKLGNIETIKRAVEANLGVSILPYETVKSEIEHGLLAGIPFTNIKILRPTALIIRRDLKPSAAVQKFIETFVK